MPACRDGGMTYIDRRFEPVFVSKRNKNEVWIFRLLPMATSNLFSFVLMNVILAILSKGISCVWHNANDDGFSPELYELVPCTNAKRSD